MLCRSLGLRAEAARTIRNFETTPPSRVHRGAFCERMNITGDSLNGRAVTPAVRLAGSNLPAARRAS